MMDYRAIVRNFVVTGSTLNDYDIPEKVAVSPFAIPLDRTREINGETSMSWTESFMPRCETDQVPASALLFS